MGDSCFSTTTKVENYISTIFPEFYVRILDLIYFAVLNEAIIMGIIGERFCVVLFVHRRTI